MEEAHVTIVAQRSRKLSIPEFLKFYDTRPDEERWQLIDGVAILVTPPFPAHQRIASNLERLLNDAFEAQRQPFAAYQRIGTELPEFPHYRPEPDVSVVDIDVPADRRFFDRFYLTAEVLSDSDDERIELKRAYYRAHIHNRAILLIRQDRAEVELDIRHGSDWRSGLLRGPEAILELPDFGLTCRVRELYRNTPVASV